ncbi:MAG: CoB--CoM heterodisulfide reductase iron-sulfur subunit B family protein [Desulfobacteraceae bacterium]|jgi:heterodisulfide reductase subunit B|nr:CoB--CoM heterodisulfide reductase iron-sulfur subunit B family protein [Desulfobacteraceae bacterium]
MMKYLYYPGCSLEGTAREYDVSTRAFLEALDVELVEIEDWTCCGASAAEAVNRLLSLALPARVLAKAEGMGTDCDILVPCSACYLNLKRAAETAYKEPATLDAINAVLAEEDLRFEGRVRVRHLLDVVAVDIGAQRMAGAVQRPLTDLSIAPYYGCQCLRPFVTFDDPEKPTSMEPLIEAAGARVHRWTMGAKCCGASHMNTKTEVGVALVAAILREARGADAVVTVCPMCQMNLDGYQSKVSRSQGEALSANVLYLPQLLGLALGLSPESLGMAMNLAVSDELRRKIA